MKILRDYRVAGALYQGGTGPEAQVGDQVRLFLNTEANPGFPESVVGTIQQPVTRVDCGTETSYNLEYDEADLAGAAALLRPDDVVDAMVVTALDLFRQHAAKIAVRTSPTQRAGSTAATLATDEFLAFSGLTNGLYAVSGWVEVETEPGYDPIDTSAIVLRLAGFHGIAYGGEVFASAGALSMFGDYDDAVSLGGPDGFALNFLPGYTDVARIAIDGHVTVADGTLALSWGRDGVVDPSHFIAVNRGTLRIQLL